MAKTSNPPRICCKRKRSKASNAVLEDRLSSLPDEILVAILSLLTIKEAATIGVVSRKWKQLWHCYPNLSFEYPRYDTLPSEKYRPWIRRQRPILINRINCIVQRHTGPSIHEFKVIFSLNHKHHSHIDKWVDFAFEKHVKSLHLGLQPNVTIPPSWKPYTLQFPLQFRNRNFDTFQSTLKSLCLSHVQICDEMYQCFLSCFPLLEIFRIVRADDLRNMRSCSSLHLKHLEVDACRKLQVIDLCVPQLLTFNYKGQPVELQLRNASSLSAVSVVSLLPRYPIAYAFDSFLTYYSQQLEYLELQPILKKEMRIFMGSSPCLLLPNLKHLSLYVVTEMDSNLVGWTPLIKAAPVLQKLTLKFEIEVVGHKGGGREKFVSHPLNCLKTLEIVGFKGHLVDLELAMYVVENAIVLEEVIVNPRWPFYLSKKRCSLDKLGQDGALKLTGKLPTTAKLIVK